MAAADIIKSAKKGVRTALNEVESKQLLKQAGINTTEIKLAKGREEAMSCAKKLGFPAVLKIVDAEKPPLRVFFGSAPLQIAKADYENRLRTWEEWQPVSELAQG